MVFTGPIGLRGVSEDGEGKDGPPALSTALAERPNAAHPSQRPLNGPRSQLGGGGRRQAGGGQHAAAESYYRKIQQMSEGSMFGHGLKHLFHSRRRSREREHQNSQESSQQQHHGMSDHDSPDEKERSPEMHRVSYAMSLHDLPARPTAFNRVLQQIRSRPSIKRGTSLHSGSRRAKSSSLEPQKGSPHLVRKAPQDSSLTAILHQHQGRPRSSSTTDTALLMAEGGTVYLLAEESECLTDKETQPWNPEEVIINFYREMQG
ncbi:UNVERIFIED_CONTAM: Transmembrane and coiled-coil domains protein 2 [Gekko kuhli]